MADTVYLTPAEWQDMMTGMDFAGLSDPQIAALIQQASAYVDTEVGGQSLLLTQYVNEEHPWRFSNSRRAYPYNHPLVSCEAVRLRVTPTGSQAISSGAIYINKTGHYIEIDTLALTFGVAEPLIPFGIVEPQLEIDYTAGFETIPFPIKVATAMSAVGVAIDQDLVATGSAGPLSFTIGSYMATYGNKFLGGIAGFSNFMPAPAKMLLKGYGRSPISLR